jgi:hypothetical protein
MKSRCNNSQRHDFGNYGGRGITYARAWEKFEAFLADMGDPPPGMTLERTNNSRGYSAKNCRWATRSEQALNKRSCVRYTLNGKSQTLAEWSRETGIGYVTMLKRIQRGVPLKLALTTVGFLRMPRKET